MGGRKHMQELSRQERKETANVAIRIFQERFQSGQKFELILRKYKGNRPLLRMIANQTSFNI
jgi:hypothetical protein